MKGIPMGQRVAACVPYTKSGQEWIVASVVSFDEERRTYVVKDEYPENRKLTQWKDIAGYKVIRFPSEEEEGFEAGEKVLSLWYIQDSDEWSSMFYDAVVVHNIKKGEGRGTVHLRFNGDDEVYDIDVKKLVKKPEMADDRRRKNQKRKEPEPVHEKGKSKKKSLQNGNGDIDNNDYHHVHKKTKVEKTNTKPPNGVHSGAAERGTKNSYIDPNQDRKNERNERLQYRSRDLKRFNFGVLGKKMKRMEAILKEKNNNSERMIGVDS
eukprot:TRINITY_DN624_c0_g3_i2.p1 TRINITY_DN624_c0_g3~~TRINITY_DN624_c0_g3_i2.p1  ORF type:complete len:266 (+),score=67.63 TRINITY_DN624_c0_g3_i2:322-1119(+)